MLEKPGFLFLAKSTTLLPTSKIFHILASALLFNNWNVITFSHKDTADEAFEEIHKFFLDGISNNMASLVQSVCYDAMNTSGSKTMSYYVIKFVLYTYDLH